MAKLFIHVGLHKTGTTTLQRSIFPKLERVAYLGRGQQESLSEIFVNSGSASILYSDESILGKLIDVYNKPRSERKSWAEQQIEAMENLANVCPDLGVIMTFRRHDSWLMSIYKHYLRYDGRLPFGSFFTGSNNGLIAPDDLLFAPRVKAARRIFAGRLYGFFLEDMVANPREVVADLAAFVGATCPQQLELKKFNDGVGSFEASVIRFLNGFPGFAGIDHPDRTAYGERLVRRLGLSPYRIATRLGKLVPVKRQLRLDNDIPAHSKQLFADDYTETRNLLRHTNEARFDIA